MGGGIDREREKLRFCLALWAKAVEVADSASIISRAVRDFDSLWSSMSGSPRKRRAANARSPRYWTTAPGRRPLGECSGRAKISRTCQDSAYPRGAIAGVHRHPKPGRPSDAIRPKYRTNVRDPGPHLSAAVRSTRALLAPKHPRYRGVCPWTPAHPRAHPGVPDWHSR